MPTRPQRPQLSTYFFFFSAFTLTLILIHAPLLKLPYFWDELGQFVPAALDIFHDGAWIPHSTVPNVHPPGVMAYAAAVWHVTGYSILATRMAMIVLAGAGGLAVFLLSIQLFGSLRGAPAFTPVLLLFASPLFFMQSMMMQLDMPAMVLTVLVILLFLQDRVFEAALACIALVLTKETGVLAPLLLGAVLVREKRYREAAWFLPSILVLALWIAFLKLGTGHVFGDTGFTQYNVWYPLHPARIAVAFIRRFFYLFVENFHWIGTAAIVHAWRTNPIFRTRAWAIIGTFSALHIVMVSVLGGATLERYLLPVLPFFYIASAAAFSLLAKKWSRVARVAMLAGLTVGLFWNPPWPFPFENNLAAMDFVRLQVQAAEYIEGSYADKTVASAWPFPDALRRPEFGYVTRPIKTKGIEDFHPGTVLALKNDPPDVLVVYSRTWEPAWSVLKIQFVANYLKRFYFYEPQITVEQVEQGLGLFPVAGWQRRGQSLVIYAKPGANQPVIVQARPVLPFH